MTEGVVVLVGALGSKSGSQRSAGSTPATRTISCLKCSRRPESSNLARRANPSYNTPRGLSALPVGFRASIILAVSHAKFCHLMGRSLENRIT